ncbi:SRPBCC family protein [Mucilaginibacter angelicae]|uniref:SRPBCC family protein n=1 Tax=Mucilaginibacter angelicae TaxID=869718 RepID=A0ABV6LF09_9SPHI
MQPIRKELLVEAAQETAFNVFTQQMDLWWPKTHHIGSCAMTAAVLEPKPDGRWYTVHEDGSEANVGKVLTWDPYGRLVLAWQINGNFKYDPELVTEVEVNFITEGPKTTRVKFEHRNLDKLLGGEKVIADMDQGWGHIMNLYKAVADEA